MPLVSHCDDRTSGLACLAWGPGVGHADCVFGCRPRRVEVGATGVALTALVGEWVAHTLEYSRLSGMRAAFGSVHHYMGPIGIVLLVAALAAVHSTLQLAGVLERRLAELGRIETRGLRSIGSGTSPPSPRSFNLPSLAAIVWSTQCGLYVLQENLEAGVAHRATPGLTVLTGAHALAPLVHLAVVLVLVAGLWLTRRQVSRLFQFVRLVEARLRLSLAAAAPVPRCQSARAWTPIDRWGSQLWSRPPPAPRTAKSF